MTRKKEQSDKLVLKLSLQVAKKLNANNITFAEYLSIIANLVGGVFDQVPDEHRQDAIDAFILVINKK